MPSAAVRRLAAAAALAGIAACLPACFATRAAGLGPDLDPREPQKGDDAAQVYAKAQQYYRERQWVEAGDAFGKVWKDFPRSPWAADARFYEAECRFARQKWEGALELYKGFLKAQPLSPHAPLIERRLYEMGTFQIEDGAKGFFDTSGEGVDALRHLVAAFPRGDLADDALLAIAQHEMDHHRPQDAVQDLHDLLDRFPSSEWAYEARLRLARAYRELNRGARYDGDSLRRAAAQYRAFLSIVTSDAARAAEHAETVEAARAELREVEETLGSKGLEESDFYLNSGRVEAARAALRNVVRSWPDTEAAAEARRRLGTDGGSN